MRKPKTMKIEDGTVLIVEGLVWRESHWEFDHPTILLSPILRYSPSGKSIEGMVEDLVIDACVDGVLESHDYSKEFDWRGWNLNTLKKNYRLALKGKKFPEKCYQAEKWQIKFYQNADNELDCEITKL